MGAPTAVSLLCCQGRSGAVVSVRVAAGPPGLPGSRHPCAAASDVRPHATSLCQGGVRCASKFCATLSSHNLEGHL